MNNYKVLVRRGQDGERGSVYAHGNLYTKYEINQRVYGPAGLPLVGFTDISCASIWMEDITLSRHTWAAELWLCEAARLEDYMAFTLLACPSDQHAAQIFFNTDSEFDDARPLTWQQDTINCPPATALFHWMRPVYRLASMEWRGKRVGIGHNHIDYPAQWNWYNKADLSRQPVDPQPDRSMRWARHFLLRYC